MSISRMLGLLLSIAILPAVTSCAQTIGSVDPHRVGDSEKIVVVDIEVMDFYPNGWHESYSDGVNVSLDISVAKVIAPNRLAGAEFTVMHHKFGEVGAEWVVAGERLRIAVSDFAFSPGDVRIPVEDIEVISRLR